MSESIPYTQGRPQLGESDPDYQEVDLKDYIRVIRLGMKWIVASTVIVFTATLYYTFTVEPEYKATTTLLIKNQPTTATVLDFGGIQQQARIANEIELIKSRTVAENVVQRLWNSEHRNNLSLFGSRVYQPRGQRPRRFVREVISLGLYDPAEDAPKFYDYPYADTVGQRFAKRVQSRLEVNNQRETNILEVTVVSPFPEETALIVNTVADVYRDLDQEWSADEAYSLQRFLQEQVAAKQAELEQAENELKRYKEEEKIFGLEGNSQMLLDQLIRTESQYYATLADLNVSKHRKNYIASTLSEEETKLAEQLRNSMDAQLFALRQEIAQKESEQVRNASLYGENHDAVKTTRQKIGRLKDKLEEQTKQMIAQGLLVADPIQYRDSLITGMLRIEGRISSQQARLDETQKLVDLYNKELNKLPLKQLEYARLERDRSVLAETYGFMRQKLEEARISVASESGKVRIIDKALVPGGMSKPNVKLNLLLGLLLGGGLGIGLVFLREYMDNSIRSADFVERLNIPVLGAIPVVGGEQYKRRGQRSRARREMSERRQREKARKKGGQDSSATTENNGFWARPSGERLRRRLIAHEDPKSPVSEAYRQIRTNILYSQADKPVKSIIVSSPGPGEGKTTTVVNLAITFANLGKRTLIIDSDMRRPVIHRVFEVEKEPGISKYLSGYNDDFDSLVQATDIDNLSVVSCGVTPPNPSELLGSKRMADLISRLEEKWDVVLLDSPPIVAVTDAAMISTEIDSMVLVIRSGETDKDVFVRAVHNLRSVKTPLVGVVMNGVSKKSSYDTYYYYYQYYHYYGGRI